VYPHFSVFAFCLIFFTLIAEFVKIKCKGFPILYVFDKMYAGKYRLERENKYEK